VHVCLHDDKVGKSQRIVEKGAVTVKFGQGCSSMKTVTDTFGNMSKNDKAQYLRSVLQPQNLVLHVCLHVTVSFGLIRLKIDTLTKTYILM
jgi:hypothetical protein